MSHGNISILVVIISNDYGYTVIVQNVRGFHTVEEVANTFVSHSCEQRISACLRNTTAWFQYFGFCEVLQF